MRHSAVGLAIILLQISAGICFNSNAPQNKITFRQQRARLSATNNEKNNEDAIEKFQVLSTRGRKGVPKKQQTDDNKLGGWETFKSALYGTVDGVGTLSDKLNSDDESFGVQGGYSSMEQTVMSQSESAESPGRRLMNQYKSRSPVAENNQNTPRSAFDRFKATVYGVGDAASQALSSEAVGNEESRESFKPLVQSTLSSSEVQKALPDLQSSNPIKRTLAEAKIKNFEEKEKKRQRDQEREEAARKFKESIYQVGDAVVSAAETLATVPSLLSDVAAETEVIAGKVKKEVDAVPGKVENVVKTVDDVAKSVQAIPDRVQETSTNVRASVQTSVQKTKQAIDDVQAIPSKVEKSIQDTKEKVDGVVSVVEDVTTRVKVLAGLEKPKPKPPNKPPPPPPTVGDLGWKIAGGVASGTAKFAWWAGKGVATTAWNGAQSVIENPPEKMEDLLPGPLKSVKRKKFQDSKPGQTIEKGGKLEVDKEVEEALRLAQSALNFADKDTKPDSLKNK